MDKLIFFISITWAYALEGINPNQLSSQNVKSWINDYIGFEKNFGQVKDFEGKPVKDVLIRAKLPNFGIFITRKGVSYVIYSYIGKKNFDKRNRLLHPEENKSEVSYARIDVDLIDANIKEENIDFEDPLPGYTNYYLPSCPDGVLGVITYRKVRIREIYPGIDWVWRYEDGKVHHQFELKPFADISRIRMDIKYADVEIKDGKKLILKTPISQIEDGEILAYQASKEAKVLYDFKEGYITFTANYSRENTLIIDPPLALLWATYYGGSDWDEGWSIATDVGGNVVLTGVTHSADFPTYNPGGNTYYQGTIAGYDDAFILKFNNSGVRIWATYYGGSDYEFSFSITTDPNANIFVTGRTRSTDFPTYNPGGNAYYQGTIAGGSDIFILKFDISGEREWATYYGGSSYESGYSITTDADANVFLTGETSSTNFPTYDPGGNAYYQGTYGGEWADAFILKFDNFGVRKWATYYGGDSADVGISITTDASGNVFLTGGTRSANFPLQDPGGGAYYQGTKAGYSDVFILKFDNSGVRKWATYYGGNYREGGYSITTDVSGNVFLTGRTESTNFPTQDPGGGAYYQTNAGGDDPFILKFDNSGVRLWATYYGGNDNDEGTSITTDASGNVFLTGITCSIDFPTYNPGGYAYYQGYVGACEAFILEFNNSGVRKWATYYGGSDGEWGVSIATDVSGNIFVTGITSSNDFPTFYPGGNTYYQVVYAGNGDAFILKFESSISVKENLNSFKEKNNLYVLRNSKSLVLVFDIKNPSEIELDFYNINGSLIEKRDYGYFEKGMQRLEINLSGINKNTYFIKVKMGKYTETIKVLNVE
ncbi:MAG: SBBP repeat-containing protein [candidate division WOR-3 bacterium]